MKVRHRFSLPAPTLRRPAALIAGRRLADNPGAAFRAIGGLILALFVTSVSAGITTTIIADHGAPANGVAASDTLAAQFITGQTASGQALTAVAAVPATVLTGLSSIPGVQGVTVIHTDPQAVTTPKQNENDMPGLVSCAQLARTPAAGHCATGATVASITLDLSARRRLLPHRAHWTPRLARGNRLHLPAARADYRARNRQERVTVTGCASASRPSSGR